MTTLSGCWRLPLLGLLSGLAIPTWAQTVETITVNKNITYVQTSASDVIVDPEPPSLDYGGPFGFAAYVTGQNLAQPSLAGPISASGQGGGFVQTPDGWHWGFDNDWGFPSANLRDAAFGDGAYTFTANGASVILDLTGNVFSDVPLMTLTGGAWSGGKYVLDVGQPLTITTNAFTGYGTHAEDGIFLAASSDGENPDIALLIQFHSAVPGSNSASLTLPAFTFAGGRDYFIGGGFSAIVHVAPNASLPGSYNSASYDVFTGIHVTAVPEPGTWTMLMAGIGVLSLHLRCRVHAARWRRGRLSRPA